MKIKRDCEQNKIRVIETQKKCVNCGIFKFVISVTVGHCYYSPQGTKA